MEIAGTRGEILTLIKKNGEITIPVLTGTLRIATNAVRGHMAILEKEGLVTFRWEKQARGRPLKIYKLSERAEGLFPKRYEQLLEELITQVELIDGPGKLRLLVDAMAKRWAQGMKAQLQGLPAEEALKKIVNHLDLGGMIASLKREEGYYTISVFNCIYRQISLRHREMCTIIPTLVRELTGAEATVARSIHSGDACCIYHVMPEHQGQLRSAP